MKEINKKIFADDNPASLNDVDFEIIMREISQISIDVAEGRISIKDAPNMLRNFLFDNFKIPMYKKHGIGYVSTSMYLVFSGLLSSYIQLDTNCQYLMASLDEQKSEN
jgi:hypothetical protein